MYEIKTEDIYEDFSSDEKCLISVITRLSQYSSVISCTILNEQNSQ